MEYFKIFANSFIHTLNSHQTQHTADLREETESRGEMKDLDETQFFSSSSIFFCLYFSIFEGYRWTSLAAGRLWTSSINLSPTFCEVSLIYITWIEHVFSLAGSYQHMFANHSRGMSFTHQIRVYQHEKVGEKVGENTGKFHLRGKGRGREGGGCLSPTVCQRVRRMFLCFSHTPHEFGVYQHEFANSSLPREGCLAYSWQHLPPKLVMRAHQEQSRWCHCFFQYLGQNY